MVKRPRSIRRTVNLMRERRRLLQKSYSPFDKLRANGWKRCVQTDFDLITH